MRLSLNMSRVLVRLLMFQWICTTCFVTSETANDTKNLIMKLFQPAGYTKTIRPLINQHHVLTVRTDMFLNSIIDFNEQEENIKISGHLFIRWFDEFLQWNPEEYGGLESFVSPQDDIWRPDVALHNSFRTFTGLGSSNLLLRVDSKGAVVWYPYQILEATCDVDITYFPFDTQECSFKFSAWSYTKNEVELIEGNKGIYLDDYEENSRWSLVSTTADTTVNEQDTMVVFKMKLKRKSIFYVFHILCPMVLLSFLNVLTFALPVSSGERASYAVTVFLSLAVFLTIVASEIPKNSNTVPITSVYMTAMIALSTAAVITSLLESRLSFRDKYTDSIGSGYMTLYRLARICQCKHDGKSPSVTEIEWVDVVAALDFFLFWIFFLLTFVATTVLFVMANTQ